MKASRSSERKNQVELSGKVVKKKYAKGSKSEHDAVFLETDKGSYILRRMGANPFNDPELQKLVGERILATGIITNNLFLADSFNKVS